MSSMKTNITIFNPESKSLFPQSLHPMIDRRTDGKIFGSLNFTAPEGTVNDVKYLFGIVLDNSSSMQGGKLHHAIETIQNLAQIMSGNTDQIWMYLITFNSQAKLVIPLTEITPVTLPSILESLETIRAVSCTNYHAAFQLQNEVLSDIVQKMSSEKPLHVVRFFLTDGEITEGPRNIDELYDMLRLINSESSTSQLRLSTRDVVFGYGTDVQLECLKALSAQKHSITGKISCSSLVTIMKPQDIGLKVGEIVFNIMNVWGANVTVSINGGAVELFDYRQTNDQVWCDEILLTSINRGDSQQFLFQCPPVQSLIVTIKWDNLFTGESHSLEFTHCIPTEQIAPAQDFLQQLPLILGMIEIEIFKQMMAAETKSVHPDQIVQNAYQTIRQLNELDSMLSPDNEEAKCYIIKLLTDARFIVGLTTICSIREQQLALWDRRICSGGNDVVNSGIDVARRYVLGEEDFEIKAIEAMKKYVPTHDHESDFDDDFGESDCISSLPTRIPTVMPHSSHTPRFHNGSKLRRLCVLMATARRNGDDVSAKDLLDQIHQRSFDDEYDDCTGNDDVFSSIPRNDSRRRRFGLIRQMSSNPQRSDTSSSYVNVDASSSGGFVRIDPSTPSKRVCQSDDVSSS